MHFQYEIKEPNSLPARKDEILPISRETINPFSISKTLCFDLIEQDFPD